LHSLQNPKVLEREMDGDQKDGGLWPGRVSKTPSQQTRLAFRVIIPAI
jgi:hypothetical protein